MKKIILAIISAITVAACVFTSACGGGITGRFSGEITERPLLKTAKDLSEKGSLLRVGCETAVFEKGGDVSVYNYIKDADVYTEKGVNGNAFTEIFTNSYLKRDLVVLYKDVEKSAFTVYNSDGETLLQKDSGKFSEFYLDTYRAGKEIYRLGADGKLVKVKEISDADNMPRLSYKTSKYYYGSKETDSGKYIGVYDLSLGLVSTVVIPACDRSDVYVLNDGVILINCVVEVNGTEDYSYYEGGKYYLVDSYIANPSDGSLKTSPYGVYDVISVLADKVMGNSYFGDVSVSGFGGTLLIGRKIENKRLGAVGMSLIKYEGSVGIVGDVIPGMYPPVKVKDNRWFVYTDFNSYFCSDDGKIISSVDGQREDFGMGKDFFTAGGAIYDYDMNTVYDFSAEGYALFRCIDYGVIVIKDGELYFTKGETPTAVCAASDFTGCFGTAVFGVRYGDRYKYFNAENKLLFDADAECSFSAKSENPDVCIAYVSGDGDAVVYRISA